MFELAKLVIVVGLLNIVTCYFFHEPSAIEIKPNGVNNIDFGFSMGFQNGSNPNLVVSAPTDTYTGRVYGCNLTDFQHVNCNAVNIDVENLAPSNRTPVNADQKFYLGASIAATPDYFVTCAPLWIGLVKRNANDKHSVIHYGTCFVYNGNATNIEYTRNDPSYYGGGGIGWNTLVDEKKILIAKAAHTGNFLYIDKTRPFKSRFTRGLRITSFNTGYGLTFGNFFNKGNMYAFSVRETDMRGKIHFLDDKLRISKSITINSKKIGSMFGYTMSAADINEDGISDLIVGAPLYREEYDRPEFGAIHIYVGGEKITDESLRTIVATVEGGRFGMTITTADIDGDKTPEIIVSAPYENSGKGAVYILSGHEIKKILIEPKYKPIPLSKLKMTQKIQKAEYNHFGYSLQVVKDVDENGFNELVIGIPGNGSVMLYRSIHVVNVWISLNLNGTDTLQIIGDPTNFQVKVCIHVRYKTKNVPGRIIGKYIVTGDVNMDGYNFTIDLSKGETEVCNDVIGKFNGNPVGEYNFTTTIDIVDVEGKLKVKDFDNSTAVFSPDSEKYKSIIFSVFCGTGDECLPKLSLMQPQWRNGPEYAVGTSDNETIVIKVRNEGYTVATACLLVELQGAAISQLSACDVVGNGKYECTLYTLRSKTDKTTNLILDMTDITNVNRGLNINFTLYEVCDSRKKVDEKYFTAKYLLDTRAVSVTGENHNVDITDTDMSETKTKSFKVNQEYLIINSGNMRWVNLNTVIEIGKTPFNIHATVSITEKDVCSQTNEAEKIIIKCLLSLEKKSTTKVMVAVKIPKDDWAKFLEDGNKQTKIESKLLLEFDANNATAFARSESILAYNDERSLGNNIILIIIIVIILALLLLLLITVVLYRRGFFKTESKQKLLEAKETVRRKSIKKSNASGNSQQQSEEGEDKNDKEVDLQDNVFDEPPKALGAKDNHKLVEEKAQVHC